MLFHAKFIVNKKKLIPDFIFTHSFKELFDIPFLMLGTFPAPVTLLINAQGFAAIRLHVTKRIITIIVGYLVDKTYSTGCT